MIKEMRECATACADTHKTTLQTLRFCLLTGGRPARTAQLLRLLTCAELCEAAGERCRRGEDGAAAAAEACAKACEACAEDCERGDEPEMRLCAEVCRYCAHACYRTVHAVAV